MFVFVMILITLGVTILSTYFLDNDSNGKTIDSDGQMTQVLDVHQSMDFKDFRVDFKDIELNGNEITFNCLWENNSDTELSFDEMSYLEVLQGDKVLKEVTGVGSEDVDKSIHHNFYDKLAPNSETNISVTYNASLDKPVYLQVLPKSGEHGQQIKFGIDEIK